MKKIPTYITTAFEMWKETDRTVDLDVNGNSMNPLIKIGDRISIRLVGANELRTGDIFVFWKDKNTVVHRFIKKRKKNGTWRFCEKGDNCTGWTWIKEIEVLGKVETVYGSGYTLNMLRWPWVCVNPVLGFMMLVWTELYGKVSTLILFIFGNRLTPVLNRLRYKLGKVVNSIFSIVKVMWL